MNIRIKLLIEKLKQNPKQALESLHSVFETIAHEEVLYIFNNRVEELGLNKAKEVTKEEFLFEAASVSPNCTNPFINLMKTYMIQEWAKLIKSNFRL